MRLCRIALCIATASLASAPSYAADYFVSASGSDANAGTSAAAPWRSLTRVNQATFKAGDRILLAAGQTFSGTLQIGADDGGTAAAPIVVSSYGTGRATIAAGNATAVSAYNTVAVTIANIVAVGSGALSNGGSGVEVFTDLGGNVSLGPIRIDNVDVSGFGQRGISVGSWNGATGYHDVAITGVAAHDNGLAGIATFAAARNVHRNVYVGYSSAYGNTGVPGWSTNSGNGIVLGDVAGATIERCLAHDNGRLSATPEGPVGIWTYDSTGVVIQSNESYANQTASAGDGDGFDLDQNVSNSVMQYNYSHGNAGAGFLLSQGAATDTHTGNVVRYNISQNDGRTNAYGGVHVWGRVKNAEIYNNTVFMSAAPGHPRALLVVSWGVPTSVASNVHVRDNIFVTAGGAPLAETDAVQASSPGLLLQGNAWFAADGAWSAVWAGASYASLSAFRSATGQERVNGVAVGSAANPLLTGAGTAPTVGDPTRLESLAAYRLQSGSPAIDAALDLASFGVAAGSRDFFGASVPQGGRFDIGAGEAPAGGSGAGPSPFGGAAAVVPGTIEAENFDEGGEGVAYHDDSAGNSGGAYRTTGVDIEAASGGGYDVGWIAPGEWLLYTVNVATAGTYTCTARVAASGQGGTFHLELDGQQVSPPLTIPSTGGWQAWRTISTAVALPAGVHRLRIVMDTTGAIAVGNIDRLTFTLGGLPAIPGTVNAADFDDGGEGVSWHDTTAGNSGGAYRTTNVDIEAASGGGYDVGWIAPTEWMNYTVNVAAAGQYVVRIMVASPTGGGALHIGFNGPSNVWVRLPVPATGGWQNWTTISTVVTLGAGRQQITLYFDTGGFNVRSIDVR